VVERTLCNELAASTITGNSTYSLKARLRHVDISLIPAFTLAAFRCNIFCTVFQNRVADQTEPGLADERCSWVAAIQSCDGRRRQHHWDRDVLTRKFKKIEIQKVKKERKNKKPGD